MKRFLLSLVALCLLALPAIGELRHSLTDDIISLGAEHREAWYSGGQLQSNWDITQYDARILAISCASDVSNLTTYTFTALSMGAEYPDRRTIVVVGGVDALATFDVSTVTVGGASATEDTDQGGTQLVDAAVYEIANSAGTSEDVVVTFSEAVTNAAVCAISVTGVFGSISLATASGANMDTLTLDATLKAGGFVAAVCMTNDTTAGGTIPGTGALKSVQTVSNAEGTLSALVGWGTEVDQSSASMGCDPSASGANDDVGALISFISSTWQNEMATLLACTNNTADQTTYTFSAQSVGVANGNRSTLIGVLGEDAATAFTVSTVTVGGDSANRIQDEAGTQTVSEAFFALSNPEGTSEDIVVTFSEAVTFAGICVWDVRNVDPSVAASHRRGVSASGAALTLNLNVPAQAYIFGICIQDGSNSHTWNITERADVTNAEASITAADAVNTALTPIINQTLNCDGAGATAATGATVTMFYQPPIPTPETTTTFLQCTSDVSNATTYTFTSVNTGTASADRTTVVGIIAEDSATAFTISSMTIGGDTASEDADNGTGAAGGALVITGFYAMSNPAGTSEDIAVTFSEVITGAVICVWQVNNSHNGRASMNPANSFDTTSGVMTNSHTVPANSVDLGVAGNDATGQSVTWTVFTERVDTCNAEFCYSAADYDEDNVPSLPSLDPTIDYTGSGDAVATDADYR